MISKGWDICVIYLKSLKTPVRVHTQLDKFDISTDGALFSFAAFCLFYTELDEVDYFQTATNANREVNCERWL